MSSPHAQCALGIFAKAPVPGQVKTRLAATVGPEAAAQWYTQFVRIVFQRTAAAWPDVERILFYDPPDAAAVFDQFAAAPLHRIPQQGDDLGMRMAAALEYCLACGRERPILIGTDAPSLPMAFLGEAWDALRHDDVVVGPSTDGGYYLIGTRASHPGLFQDVAWSTNAVLETTQSRADELGLRLHLLPEWFDVDTADDLAALPAGWDTPV